jgi:hypothetical protein
VLLKRYFKRLLNEKLKELIDITKDVDAGNKKAIILNQ